MTTSLDDVHMPVRGGGAIIASVLFASELVPASPVFQLSTLPVNVRSVGDAQQLARLAEAQYRDALARSGYRLLMVVPWPPTGIWTRIPLAKPDALSDARVRTYDQASRNIFSSVSAEAVTLSIQDTMRELADGTLDAVLSSGDGEAGRIYARHLRNFTAIHYAYPLSFMVMRQVAFSTLSTDMQRRVTTAASKTEAQLWKDLPSRIRRNNDQMLRMGIRVNDVGDPVMSATLRAAGDREVESWRERISPEDRRIMKIYDTRYRASAGTERDTAQYSDRASHEID
jgi:TRAP-type C4-dicarboxylate transport system substrate-binding protein